MSIITRVFAVLCFFSGSTAVFAGSVLYDVFELTEEGKGDKIGTIAAMDIEWGLEERGLALVPDIRKGLSPGNHGFHVHQNASCAPGEKNGKTVPGLGAGGHFDPENTGRHEGPTGDGHLGDLPVLVVNKKGMAILPMVAPRLTTSDLKGHAIIIHADGDNYSDQPKALGGGGSRVACALPQSKP